MTTFKEPQSRKQRVQNAVARLLDTDEYGNSRNRASAAWGTFRRMLAYKCEREGTHFAEVRPHGTTKECAQCGAETDKPSI